MLRPRITPCLLIQNGGLVKTQQFGRPKYVGDPINAVKIFNEKSVDEIIIIDIDASRLGLPPNYELIEQLANEARMPICYGGGIKNREQAEKIIHMGVEKVAISSALFERPELITELAKTIGSQSIVGVLDVKKRLLKGYSLYVNNGKTKIPRDLDYWIAKFQNLGVGEILINSIDRDGMQNGYDFLLVEATLGQLSVPTTFLGGAASLADIGKLIAAKGIVGCAAGSLFVFKGKYRAVLINYPTFEDKKNLIIKSLNEFYSKPVI